MENLIAEYGDDFNWYLIPFTNNTFLNELKRELQSDDSFLLGEICAVAKCESNDDVLFVSKINNEEIWRIYHLTYSNNNIKGYPKYVEFLNEKNALEYIQNQFKSEYKYCE